jgi:hypothetical protein
MDNWLVSKRKFSSAAFRKKKPVKKQKQKLQLRRKVLQKMSSLFIIYYNFFSMFVGDGVLGFWGAIRN